MTVIITLAIVIHGVGIGPAAPPVDKTSASYQDGYHHGQDFAERVVEKFGGYETVDRSWRAVTLGALDVSAFCQDPVLAAQIPPNAESSYEPASTNDFLAGCADAVHNIQAGKTP